METKHKDSHSEPICLKLADTLRQTAECIYKLPASPSQTDTTDLREYWSRWSDRLYAIIAARGFSTDEPLQRTAILEWRHEFVSMNTAKDAPAFKQIERWYFLDPFLLTDLQFGKLVIWEMWTLCAWIRKASMLVKLNQFVNDVVSINDNTRLFAETMARDFVWECVSNCSIERLIETLNDRMKSLSIKDVDSLRVHSLLCLGFCYYRAKTVKPKSSSSNDPGQSNSNDHSNQSSSNDPGQSSSNDPGQSSSDLNEKPNLDKSRSIVTPPFSAGFALGSGIANLYAVITRAPDRLTVDTAQLDPPRIRECKLPSINHAFILHALPSLKAVAKAMDIIPDDVRELFTFTRDLLLKQDTDSTDYVYAWLEISSLLPAEYMKVRLAAEGELSECKERFKTYWTQMFRVAVKKIVGLTGLMELGLQSCTASPFSSTLTVKQQELLATIARAQESAHVPSRPVTSAFEDFRINPIIIGTLKLTCLDTFRQTVACFCDVDPEHKGPAFAAHAKANGTLSPSSYRDREFLVDTLMSALIDMKRLVGEGVDRSLREFVAQLESVAMHVFTEETRTLAITTDNANLIIRQHNSQLDADTAYTKTLRDLMSESLSVLLNFTQEMTSEFAVAWFSTWPAFVNGTSAAHVTDPTSFTVTRLDPSKFPLDRLLITHVPAMEYVSVSTANTGIRCTQEMLDLVWLQVEKGMMVASRVIGSNDPTFRNAKLFEFLLAFFARLHHNCLC